MLKSCTLLEKEQRLSSGSNGSPKTALVLPPSCRETAFFEEISSSCLACCKNTSINRSGGFWVHRRKLRRGLMTAFECRGMWVSGGKNSIHLGPRIASQWGSFVKVGQRGGSFRCQQQRWLWKLLVGLMLWKELGQDFWLCFIPPISPPTVHKRSGFSSSSSTAISGGSECDLVPEGKRVSRFAFWEGAGRGVLRKLWKMSKRIWWQVGTQSTS